MTAEPLPGRAPARAASPLRRGLAIVLTLAAIAVLAGLGAWQLSRGAEKRETIARLLAQAAAPARALPPEAEWGDFARANDLARVTLTGRFLDDRTRRVRATLPAPRPSERRLGGLGVWLVTPLELADGARVLVNRGFVPSDVEGRIPPLPAPAGVVTVVGLVRQPEAAGAFTPADRPERGEFNLKNPATLATGLDRVAPFIVDAERAGDALSPPVGVDARELAARVPDNHTQYAIIWFALALSLAVMGLVWLRQARR